ncbi:MAG: hypothetical protein K2X47_05605, partial [Bdellovibrionales bacterium]|nr:hypothetical protein [Bdellovibrionales bacterium]
FVRFDITGDPYKNQGFSIAFNTNNVNPNGTALNGNLVKFGKKMTSDIWGIVASRISNTVPPRPKPVKTFGRLGRAKPREMKNAAGGNEFYSAESVVSIYGEDLWVGTPVPPDQLWDPNQKKFKTKVGSLEILVNGVPTQLLYVGPTQINLLLPDTAQMPLGEAEVELRDSESYAFGFFPITSMSPGLYMAGAGFANGRYDVQVPVGLTPVGGSLITASGDGAEVPSSTAGRPTILTLWGTGFSTATEINVLTKLISSGGRQYDAHVYYARAHQTKGLCQLMIVLPEGLPTDTYSVVLLEKLTGLSSNGAFLRVRK